MLLWRKPTPLCSLTWKHSSSQTNDLRSRPPKLIITPVYSLAICIHYNGCAVLVSLLTEQIGPNCVQPGPTWDSFNELISSSHGAASCVCLWVLVLLTSRYLSTVVGSPCVSSQGNSHFEWGLADSFKRESWNMNKAAHSAHPKLQQHNKQKGTDMSPYRASHWWGWHWKIPAWACPRVHHKTCAHKYKE